MFSHATIKGIGMNTMQEFKYKTTTGFVIYARITDLNNGSFLAEVGNPIKDENLSYDGEYIVAIDPIEGTSSPDTSAFEAFVKINKSIALLLSKEKPLMHHSLDYIDNLCNTPFLSVDDIKLHFDTPPEIRVNGQAEG